MKFGHFKYGPIPLSKFPKSKGSMAPLKNLSISLCLTRACNCVIKLLEKRNGYDDKTKAWSWTDLAYLMKVRSECEWFAPFFCITLMISNYTFTFTYHDSIYKTVPPKEVVYVSLAQLSFSDFIILLHWSLQSICLRAYPIAFILSRFYSPNEANYCSYLF